MFFLAQAPPVFGQRGAFLCTRLRDWESVRDTLVCMETLFVSALPFRVTEGELSALFAPYGEVGSVSIAADWDNSSFEPYAHIEVSNPDAAIAALDGYIINSTYLRVNKLVVLE